MVDTPVLVAGFDDVAMVRQAVQKGGCHFGIGEHGWPFSEGKVGCQQNGCAFVAFADELEEQAPAGVRQWEIAVKAIILCELYNLSDEQVEYQVRDRLSFMRFPGLGLEDPVPDARTIWLDREQLAQRAK